MADTPEQTEAKKALKSWCEMQREKYGENWKEILAKEMTAKSEPFLKFITALNRKPE